MAAVTDKSGKNFTGSTITINVKPAGGELWMLKFLGVRFTPSSDGAGGATASCAIMIGSATVAQVYSHANSLGSALNFVKDSANAVAMLQPIFAGGVLISDTSWIEVVVAGGNPSSSTVQVYWSAILVP